MPEDSTFGPNAWLVDEMYERYRADPASVSESWQDFFADYEPAENGEAERVEEPESEPKSKAEEPELKAKTPAKAPAPASRQPEPARVEAPAAPAVEAEAAEPIR